MEALCLINQRLLRELGELTRQVKRPQETQHAREGHNTIPQEEQQHLDAPRGVDGGGENTGLGGMIPTYPPEKVVMRGCLAGMIEVMIQPLISRGRENNLGSNGSKTFSKSLAT